MTRLNPRHAGHHGCLGVMLVASEKYVEAEKMFLRAIELDPRQSLYPTNLGVCLENQKRFRHAERRYREGLALSPESSFLHLRLGRLLMMLRREEEGLTHFERAVASSPDALEPRMNLALLHAPGFPCPAPTTKAPWPPSALTRHHPRAGEADHADEDVHVLRYVPERPPDFSMTRMSPMTIVLSTALIMS